MTPVLTEDAIRRLPEPIVQKLRSLIARIRRVLWWRGFWSTLASLVAVLLAIMAIDAAFDLEAVIVRCALSLAGAAVVGWVAWRTLVRPLSRTFGLAQVARLVEIHHPEMHERISTAVELLGSKDAAGLRGSDELLAEVVKSAVVDVQSVSPEKEYSSLPMRWPRRLAAGALAVLALVLAIWPFQGGMLVARALLPFANIGSASAFDLRVITQDTAVGEGEPLTILVAAKGRAAKRVELRREPTSSADGPATAPPTTERLMPQTSDQARPGETVFALTLPAVQDSFRYAATSGRARTKAFFVEVQRRPDITGLRVVYSFPPYTGLPPKTDPDSLGDIAALAGTRIDVTATLSQPATSATLVYDQTENAGPEVTLDSENGVPVARWSAELTPGMNYRWTLHPKGAGDRLGKPASGSLRALEDLPPAVVIDSPIDRELELRPNEVLPILYTAADDHGFSAVDLRVQIDGKGDRLLSVPLPDKDPQIPQTWHGTATLDLSKLPLAGAREVRVRLRVADSLPPNLDGPQSATADDIVIRLNWGAETFARQTLRKQEDQLRRELEQVKNDLWDQRRQAEEKSWQLKNPEQMDSERLRQLEQLTERTATSARQLEEIARRAAQSAFAERADAIEQTARNQVQSATQSLQEIPQSDRAEARAASAEQARNQLESAARQLDEVLSAFNQDREQGQELGELASLAREQQQLADQAAQAAPTPPPAAESTPPKPAAPSAQPAPADPSSTPTPATDNPAATAAAPEPATPPPGTNPLTDPTATPEQRQEAFERWQQHQDSVEHRAQNVANQFQQKVPADRQSDLARLAAQAESLARQAHTLAARQDQVAAQAGLHPPTATDQPTTDSPTTDSPTTDSPTADQPTPAAASPQTTAQAAQQQADVAALAGQLAESVKQLQEQSRNELRQNGKAESQAESAATALDTAAEVGRQASSALAQEATQSATTPTSTATPPASTPPAATAGSPPPSADASAATAATPTLPPAESAAESATTAEAAPGPQSPAPANPAAVPSASPSTPTPGQQAVAKTGESLDAAAAALQEMARALSGQSEGVAAASEALTAATAQTKQASDAGDAARQAGQQAADAARATPGSTPERAAAAESAARLQALADSAAAPAQQAANNLALAAATAQAAMGLPENALGQQNMGKNGSPKPGDGQQGQSGQTAQNNQPSNQPGNEATDTAGFQTTKDYGLPPELAKLGMSPDDWARLRSLVTSGTESTAGDQVPAEYRDLVRGYFRALSSGASSPAPK
jgi:hypothetical protein